MPASTTSPRLARRMLLAAQGFDRPRPTAIGPVRVERAVRRLGALQLDSVNVFERSHYLPLWSRFGPYDRAHLDRLAFASPAAWTEWWAHEAAIIPVEDLPLWGWRKAEYRARDPWLPGFAGDHRALLDELLARLAAEGPMPASRIEHEANRRDGPWWGWSAVKRGLEALFRRGEVVAAGRERFERRYGLPEQVLPASALAAPDLPREDAIRELVRRSAVALGIGTVPDLADYFRLRNPNVRPAVADLVDAGELVETTVPGWRHPAYVHRDARRPRVMRAAALLSPFDPVVWDRDRAERHFGFRYRIEIYTPAAQRVHGYYSLPILLDEALVGRIDLKSDRRRSVLRVQSAWREEGADADPVRIADLVRDAAEWQGLGDVEVGERGDLAADLRVALRR